VKERGQLHAPASLLHGTHNSGGWVSRSGQFLEKTKCFVSNGIRAPDCPACNLRYANYDITFPSKEDGLETGVDRTNFGTYIITAEYRTNTQCTGGEQIPQKYDNNSPTNQEESRNGSNSEKACHRSADDLLTLV